MDQTSLPPWHPLIMVQEIQVHVCPAAIHPQAWPPWRTISGHRRVVATQTWLRSPWLIDLHLKDRRPTCNQHHKNPLQAPTNQITPGMSKKMNMSTKTSFEPEVKQIAIIFSDLRRYRSSANTMGILFQKYVYNSFFCDLTVFQNALAWDFWPSSTMGSCVRCKWREFRGTIFSDTDVQDDPIETSTQTKRGPLFLWHFHLHEENEDIILQRQNHWELWACPLSIRIKMSLVCTGFMGRSTRLAKIALRIHLVCALNSHFASFVTLKPTQTSNHFVNCKQQNSVSEPPGRVHLYSAERFRICLQRVLGIHICVCFCVCVCYCI